MFVILMISTMINFLFVRFTVWSYLPSDVNRDKLKLYGNLVRCNGLRGKAKTVTCGTVLGVIECHGNAQIFHLVNVRQILCQRLPGPLSSFRYNLKAKVDPIPIVFSDKKKIIHSLIKIPVNTISNNTPEYVIRTVHSTNSHVEIDYIHVQEHESVQGTLPEVDSSRTKSASSGSNGTPEVDSLGHVHNFVHEEQQDETAPNGFRCSPNSYPDLGCATYDQFLSEMQPVNIVQGETLEVSPFNTVNRLNNSQEGMASPQYCENVQMDVAAGRVVVQSQEHVEMPSGGVIGDSVRVFPFEDSKNFRTTSVITSSVPKDVVVFRNEAATPGYFHEGEQNHFCNDLIISDINIFVIISRNHIQKFGFVSPKQ